MMNKIMFILNLLSGSVNVNLALNFL